MTDIESRSVDWARWLCAGDRIVCSHMTAEPVALLRSMAQACNEGGLHEGRFDIHLGVPYSMAAADFPAATRLTTFGGMGTAGALARSRAVQVSMDAYSRYDRDFDCGDATADGVLVSLARDADGRLHLGAAHGGALAAARHARCVIAEVNAQAPVVLGAPWPDEVRIDAQVDTDYALPEAAAAEPGEVERRIAAQVAPLVPDGACLQVGIGTLPSAVLEGLQQHRALGLHSGMLTPSLWQLVTQGVIDNSAKTLDVGLAVAGIVYGTAALYRAVHRHPAVRLREPGYTHYAAVIAQLRRFTAINSALEVDLLGQLNAETVAAPLSAKDGTRRQVGGVGGLNDFIRAARLAPEGRSIVALPSRQAARGGLPGAPRIVAALGGPATVAAQDADVIVTEHGVARLRGATLEQRAQRLIAIAHPDDRDALRLAAKRSGQWP